MNNSLAGFLISKIREAKFLSSLSLIATDSFKANELLITLNNCFLEARAKYGTSAIASLIIFVKSSISGLKMYPHISLILSLDAQTTSKLSLEVSSSLRINSC